LNAKTYPNKIRDLTQDLPGEKGILYLQDENGKIIFSDFVNDLNKSAKIIFNATSKKWRPIQEKTVQVHYEFTGSDILAKLMMRTKGLKKTEALPFGLYHKTGRYFADKITNQPNVEPFLQFKSFTQGSKAV